MAKAKKKTQQTQQLSPINYIRQKARNLPIHECWINSDWKSHGEAKIIVSRIHANGHYTFGVYLVDLYCLGIKDAFYNFNVDEDLYAELLERVGGENSTQVSYDLVHNIIYAAKEYADELGFKPHNDFTSVAQFILEEDTEDIELIDIECGFNGKPLYVDAGHESPEKAKQIINQLTKVVGAGNFKVKIEDNDFFDEDDFDEDNDEEDTDINELKEEFIGFTKKNIDHLNEDEKFEFINIMDSIFYRIVDNDRIDDLLDEWNEETLIETNNSYQNEQLGIDPNIPMTHQEYESFEKLLELAFIKSNKYGKEKEKMRERWGELPFFGMLDLTVMKDSTDSFIYHNMVNRLNEEFPDYPFFILQKYQMEMSKMDNTPIKILGLEDVFRNKEIITSFEFNHFLEVKTMTVIYNNDPEELEAMLIHFDDLDWDEDLIEKLKLYLILARYRYLREYFDLD
jgi:hypothetical protein